MLSEKQKAFYRRKCLNGERPMTHEEQKARKRVYMAAIKADPFRRAQYADYFRKRRKRTGMQDRINAQARARYHKDIEAARAYNRSKYHAMMADPERKAAFNARRVARRQRMKGALMRERLRSRLMPLWLRVVADGRDETYQRRTTPEIARLFRMWRDNRPLFDEMVKALVNTGRKVV